MGLSKHHSLVYEHDFRLGSVVRVRSGIKSVDLLYLQHDLRFHVTLSKQNGMQVMIQMITLLASRRTINSQCFSYAISLDKIIVIQCSKQLTTGIDIWPGPGLGPGICRSRKLVMAGCQDLLPGFYIDFIKIETIICNIMYSGNPSNSLMFAADR